MSLIRSAQALCVPLPPVMATLIHQSAWAAMKQSAGGFFAGKRGVRKLGPLWVLMLTTMSRQLHLNYNEEDICLLFEKLAERLDQLDEKLDEQEKGIMGRGKVQVRPMSPHLAGAKIAATAAFRLCRDAALTEFYGRSAAHAFIRYRDSLPVDQLADAIVGIASEHA